MKKIVKKEKNTFVVKNKKRFSNRYDSEHTMFPHKSSWTFAATFFTKPISVTIILTSIILAIGANHRPDTFTTSIPTISQIPITISWAHFIYLVTRFSTDAWSTMTFSCTEVARAIFTVFTDFCLAFWDRTVWSDPGSVAET